jgi:hypothetical protein
VNLWIGIVEPRLFNTFPKMGEGSCTKCDTWLNIESSLMLLPSRKCQYVDRVLQMRDGKLVQVIEDKKEIVRLATGGLTTEGTSY